jgi:type IV pilus assembly protein PilY1
MYYYENDLDSSLDDRVPVSPEDDATHQHLVTYSVTFGVTGNLDPDDYDFESGIYPTWPSPINDDTERIDDMWHAAVNGRGLFMSSNNPEELVEAFVAVMANIESRIGSAASVSVNGDELYGSIAADVHMFQSSYTSDGWSGDVKGYTIDETTGEVNTSTPLFSTATVLEGMTYDNRIIATYDGASGIPFREGNLTATQKGQLTSDPSEVTDLVNFLRGDYSNDQLNGGPYRSRNLKMGDVVHSSPLFEDDVLYTGANDGMVHAFAAVDSGSIVAGQEIFAYIPNLVFDNLKNLSVPGYSHLFYVDETPAVVDTTISGVATLLVGGLGKGGKGYYALNVSDPFSITSESTLAGNVLWEYPDSGTPSSEIDDMGYSFSAPAIVGSNDTSNAEWIVLFGNGYNSTDGYAKLVILDATDGTLIRSIDTGIGSCNGLSSPVPIDYNYDNKVDYVYAGDLKGNLWKFDLTDSDYNNWEVAYADSGTPKPLFTAQGPGNIPQPITTKPDVMQHCEKHGYIVVFGTGRYLGDSDFTNTEVQSIYGVWDYGDAHDDSEYPGTFDRSGAIPVLSNLSGVTFLKQEIIPSTEADTNFWTVSGNRVRVLTNSIGDLVNPWETVDETSPDTGNPDPIKIAGWYFDLPVTGERVPSDLLIRDAKVIVATFTPEQNPCGTGGESVIMEMDACSGGRTSEPQLDINDDGLINADDLINIGTEEDPIWVAPTGIEKPGRLLPPAILIMDDIELKYFSTNVGTIVTQREKAVKIGVTHWIEK